jgi:hypothetical protein
MVREDGKKLYRVVDDQDLIDDVMKHEWLRKNVIPSLPIVIFSNGEWDWDLLNPDIHSLQPKYRIAEDVKRFITDTPSPELWAYYGAYDHVALCQLFGRMVDLPMGIPMYTNDIKSELVRLNLIVPEQTAGKHNALSDAQWNMETLNLIRERTFISYFREKE